MSITYTPTTNFGSKDSLPSNDPNKVIKGSEFTIEFSAIQTAFGLAAPTSNPTFTGTATFDDISANTISLTDVDVVTLDVTGTATLADADVVTLDVTGTSTLADADVVTLDVTGTSTLADADVTTLDVTGTSTLADADVTTLDVTGTSTLADADVTTLDVTGTSTLADADAVTLDVTGTLTASGLLYPTTDGTDGQAIFTDGNGTLAFGDVAEIDPANVNFTGGTMNGVVIGGVDPEAATFTTVVADSAVAGTETTSISGSTALDFTAQQNFVLTLTGTVTLANPTTETVGQSGFIVMIQDATGGRTVSLGTEYETAGAGGLALSTAASTTDIVPYVVAASGRILLGAPQLAFG